MNKPNSLPSQQIENQPRRFGKSTLVTNAFLASCKAGEAVKYEHPDFVAYSRKAIKQELEACAEGARKEAKFEIYKYLCNTGYMNAGSFRKTFMDEFSLSELAQPKGEDK